MASDCLLCRWGNKEFGIYVQQLQKHVDEILLDATDGVVEEATAAVKRVAELEDGFWNMACGA